MPAYVLIGYPNVTRGPGFLGVEARLRLPDRHRVRARPASTPAGRRRRPAAERREGLLEALRADYAPDTPATRRSPTTSRPSRESRAARRARSSRGVFRLDSEPAALRESYGGEFGQRCLLARRLVEAGVRFVEVSHNLNFLNGTGWDTHNQGQLQQHVLIHELDHALSALLDDLERVGRLDSTLVVVATEFGRPPEFDARRRPRPPVHGLQRPAGRRRPAAPGRSSA